MIRIAPSSENLLPQNTGELVKQLLAWFAANKRPLPWRKKYTPYEVWVSEIMLQQTKMERGVAFFERWMEQFPTVRDVAAAPLDAILKAWEGLGYYSRARNLHKAAQEIVQQYGDGFPDSFTAIRALPGVGEYTAGAILSIAYQEPVAAVDANVERVFSRLFDIDAPVKSPEASRKIRALAAAIIPQDAAREFNQALMEFGALVCNKRPRCELCPLVAYCQAKYLNIVLERPVPGKKTLYEPLEIICGVLIHRGKIFLQKRLEQGAWAGLWEFPGGKLELDETPEQGVVREYEEETEFTVRILQKLGVVRHAYTRYRIAMHCYICILDDAVALPCTTGAEALPHHPQPVLHAATEARWLSLDAVDDYPLPAGHRKLFDTWRELLASVIHTLP